MELDGVVWHVALSAHVAKVAKAVHAAKMWQNRHVAKSCLSHVVRHSVLTIHVPRSCTFRSLVGANAREDVDRAVDVLSLILCR